MYAIIDIGGIKTMNRQDFDNLLQELTSEELTTDRQLEIFKSLQDDKDKSITDYQELLDNSNNLQESYTELESNYNKLKKKSVEDFFNKGKKFEPNNEPDAPEKVITYEDLLKDI